MASSKEFAKYVCEQLAGAGEITCKSMFGGFGIYCGGVFFGVICDNQFFIKITESGRALLPDAPEQEPYEGSKPWLLVENLEDTVLMAQAVQAVCRELPPPKLKTPRKRKTKAKTEAET